MCVKNENLQRRGGGLGLFAEQFQEKKSLTLKELSDVVVAAASGRTTRKVQFSSGGGAQIWKERTLRSWTNFLQTKLIIVLKSAYPVRK
jgi:hypothetical protein